jgi:uncharacterized protein (TIGR00369 family)
MSFGAFIPFVELLGFELTRFEGGESTLQYTPKPEHLNSFDVLHGGVVMTLLDVGMASAARSVQPELGVLTIEMKTSFMRASPGDGSTLTVKSTLLHRTGRMAFVEGRIFDAQGQLCAQATGTFKYAPRQTALHSVATD